MLSLLGALTGRGRKQADRFSLSEGGNGLRFGG